MSRKQTFSIVFNSFFADAEAPVFKALGCFASTSLPSSELYDAGCSRRQKCLEDFAENVKKPEKKTT